MARRNINEIITEINQKIEQGVTWTGTTYHTIAVLQPRDGESWPMKRLDSDQQGQRISPEDTSGLQIYHRIISEEIGPPEQGKGAAMYNEVTYTMRLLGVGYRPPVTQSTWWNNEEIAQRVMTAMAATSRLQNKELFFVEGQAVTDKLTVLNEEYQNNEEVKQWVLRLLAFAVTYTIKLRTVGNDC